MTIRTTRRGFQPVAFFFGVLAAVAVGWGAGPASSQTLQTFRGSTMGTTYMVKVSTAGVDAPIDAVSIDRKWYEETAMLIDRELRSVNDEMSTYLKTSELSRFNDSSSTDWFPVSADTAWVVELALRIGEQSGGLFDVTVGPLVDRWSFGPGERHQDVPADTEIAKLKERVGHGYLEVRSDPPAMKKSIPELRVDLSAIAKGHGVDRLIDLLNERQMPNLFVEIGGEVRVSGSKQTSDGPRSWMVGIQKPDAGLDQIALAHPMENSAMATSGDYRNYFEVGGRRYSHTIDPTTGRPIEHALASVTVIMPTCAEADGWATALNVAGRERAVTLAQQHELDSLLISRNESRTKGNETMIDFEVLGTGGLKQIAATMNESGLLSEAGPLAQAGDAGFAERMMPILVLTGIAFVAVVISMAVGVLFGRKAISGSCGGLNAKTDPDGTTRCSMCSNPSDGCKELREKIQPEQKTRVEASDV